MAIDAFLALLNRFAALEIQRKVFIWVTMIGIFVAGYQAWSDEHAERENIQQKLNRATEEIASLKAHSEIATGAEDKINKLIEENKQLQQKVGALEQKELPRRLTDEQRKKMADALKKISSKESFSSHSHRLIFEVVFGCNECRIFAGDIIEVWKRSPGWEVHSTNNLGIDPKLNGVVVGAHPMWCPAVAAQLISDVLHAGGISHEARFVSDEERKQLSVPSTFCLVIIGNKP